MQLASGVDLIEIERIAGLVARYGPRFLGRVFTPGELADCREQIPSLAARFAAKEAVSKALGTGIGPVAWGEIEIVRGPQRQPLLRLHGAAAQKAAELGLTTWSVSISHTATHALALAVATGSAENTG